jgi:formate hydrogenlyase subunit 6/NADH:ubiquinone oxidoreductase subunit I
LVAELLLARAPDAPQIKHLAAELDVHQTDLPSRNEQCILCGRCVRACARLGLHAIDFAWRGIQRQVSAPFGKPSEVCIACQACVHVCPTGAIESTLSLDRVQILPPKGNTLDLPRSRCTQCGTFYVPQRAWNYLQDRQLGLPLYSEPVCPSCRRKEYLERLWGSSGMGHGA